MRKFLAILFFIIGFSQSACAKEKEVFSFEECQKLERHSARHISCLSVLANQGNVDAQVELAGCFYEKRDAEKTVYWFQKAAEAGNAYAENMMGSIYERGTGNIKDYDKAFEYYTKAAEKGMPFAQANVGRFYYYGIGHVKQDYSSAIKWYTLAAAQKNPFAAKELGNMYFNGIGVTKNSLKAIDLFEISANYGDWEIQTLLGEIYFDGLENISKDYSKAFYWFQKSAEKGDDQAQRKLSELYLYGMGTEKNEKLSQYWLSRSIEDEVRPEREESY